MYLCRPYKKYCAHALLYGASIRKRWKEIWITNLNWSSRAGSYKVDPNPPQPYPTRPKQNSEIMPMDNDEDRALIQFKHMSNARHERPLSPKAPLIYT